MSEASDTQTPKTKAGSLHPFVLRWMCLVSCIMGIYWPCGNLLGQDDHVPHRFFNPRPMESVMGPHDALASIAGNLRIVLLDGVSALNLPLPKSQLNRERLSLPPALGLNGLLMSALLRRDPLSVSLVGRATLHDAVDEQDERTDGGRKNAADDGGAKNGIREEFLDFWSHDFLIMYAKLSVAAVVLGVVGGLWPSLMLNFLERRGFFRGSQNDSSAGNGERKTLNTRQTTSEPLPASLCSPLVPPPASE